jgi:hypothetical protein
MSPEDFATRIREEYAQLPGLRLTISQACRLWHVDSAACEVVLQRLVRERFLARTRDGLFFMLPPERPRPAKATLRNTRDVRQA